MRKAFSKLYNIHPELIVRYNIGLFCLFDLVLYVPSTIFQLNRDGSFWAEPVLSYVKCVLLKDHNAVTLVRLEPAASRSRVKHSTTEPLRSHNIDLKTLLGQGISELVHYMVI